MADQKISDLPSKATIADADILTILDSVTGNGNAQSSAMAMRAPLVASIADLAARVTILEGGGPPVISHLNFLGIKATSDFTAADFTVEGMDAGLVIPGAPNWPAGERRFIAYGRPESMGDFTFVYYYPAGNRNTNSQLGAWLQAVSTIVLGGEPHNILISRGALRDSARGRVVEAGG